VASGDRVRPLPEHMEVVVNGFALTAPIPGRLEFEDAFGATLSLLALAVAVGPLVLLPAWQVLARSFRRAIVFPRSIPAGRGAARRAA
jgi:hypothetical protein